MAASRRSPLMRDQWRVDDDDRDCRDCGPQDRPHRGQHSPFSSRRPETADLGLKIKGRAGADIADPPKPRFTDHSRSRRRLGDDFRASSQRRSSNGEEFQHTREVDEERFSKRRHARESSPATRRHKESRSTTPDRRPRQIVHDRRRSRSPGRIDRGVKTGERDRGRAYSPHQFSRERRYALSGNRQSTSVNQTSRGSYVASSHRDRERSPEQRDDQYRPNHNRHLSESPDRHRRHHKHNRQSSRNDGRERYYKDHKPSATHRDIDSHSRTSSPPRSTRSSKRSEKQKARTRQHLVTKPRSVRVSQKSSTSPNPESTSRTMSTRPIQSILDEEPRQPSPPRPIPSFDDSNVAGDTHIREAFPMHGMKASDVHPSHRRVPAHIDTRQPYATSPQYMTPTSSHHGSPQPGSPYSHGRGGWGGQQQHFHGQPGQQMNAYSPPFRQTSYPPPNAAHPPYYSTNQHVQYPGPAHQMQPGFQSPSYRGGHGGMRGNHFAQQQDRRFSGSGPPNYGVQAPRGRGGHFQNLQWTANSGTRGRGQSDQSYGTTHHQSSQSQSPPSTLQQPSFEKPVGSQWDEEIPFQVSMREDEQNNNDTEMGDTLVPQDQQMPPPVRQSSETSPQSQQGSKFSFAFSKKAPPPPTPKSVPDLAQKMKEPPVRKEVLVDNTKVKLAPPMSARDSIRDTTSSKSRLDRRSDTRIDRRDDRRDRDHQIDRRYRDDRRIDRDDRRPENRIDRRPEQDRERERSPEMVMVKKIMKRMKPRPTLPADFAASDSVYYRKPGNESVVGSGTYGKVFKAIHVYTKELVALKKIRMEGEKDGFPVTAVREVKLLQSLKHANIVSLREVMVEKNDCFMVFEYLSHDLTGLLNHPTFKLEQSHKKHLAKQLFEGLDYLHRRGVLHRDIKAANILVSNTGQLKLADFGLARFYAKRRQMDYTNRVITIWYRPPELLLGETQYGPAVDIWSAACVMIEIFTKKAIFPGDGGEISQLEKVYDVLGTPTKAEWPGLVDMQWFELLRPTEKKSNTFEERYRERLTPAAFELLQAMFLYDPSKRPTAGDVLEHPYFATEEPRPEQAVELKDLEGDWHEFESKAHRRENDRKDKEARKLERQEAHEREKAKRRASGSMGSADRDPKRLRPSSSQGVGEGK